MGALRRLRAVPPELWLLAMLALGTRCWRLFTPGQRVWDEVHYEEFASRYFSGSYYVDVHPPLGKLLIALEAWVMRIPAATFTDGVSVPQLRLLPALMGALLVPTFWWFLRELGASRKVAAFGGALLLLDNALLVQSRFVLLDVMLVWFGLAAVAAYLAARRSTGGARWRGLAAAALLAGAAVSTKWTGLSALGLIGLVWLVDAWRASGRTPRRRMAGELLLLGAVPAAVYVGAFAVHFALLPNDGIGVRLMSPAFAATLRGNLAYRADAPLSFAGKLAELHGVVLSANQRFTHVAQPAASPWYTWPIAKHRIQYWQGVGDVGGESRRIELMGNPVLWYGILVALALGAAALALRRVSAGPLRGALLIAGVGYVMNFAPFALITRPMYLYHYLLAFVYSAALAALLLGRMAGWQDDDGPPWRFRSPRARALYVGLLAVLAASFAYFAPLSYGTALSAGQLAQRDWVLERH